MTPEFDDDDDEVVFEVAEEWPGKGRGLVSEEA